MSKAQETEMIGILSNFQKSVTRLKGKAEDKERIKRCEELMQRFDLSVENFQVDLASVEDAGERVQWNQKLDKHMEIYSQTKLKFQDQKREYEKNSFLKTKTEISSKAKLMTGDEDISTLDRQGAVAAGDVMVQKAQASLGRAKQMALEAEQIGNQTVSKMQAQNEKMEAIYESLEEIEGNLARSRKLLGKIAQSAVNDRFIQMLCVLIFIAVVIAITLDKTSPDGKGTSNTVGEPAARRLLMN
jgi:hypothetical protein